MTQLTFKTREEAMKYFVKKIPITPKLPLYLNKQFDQWLTDEKIIIKEEQK